MRPRAWGVGVEETEALGGAQADGAGHELRVPVARGWTDSEPVGDCGDTLCHAAARTVGAAFRISCRMARLLNPKVISAEAR